MVAGTVLSYAGDAQRQNGAREHTSCLGVHRWGVSEPLGDCAGDRWANQTRVAAVRDLFLALVALYCGRIELV